MTLITTIAAVWDGAVNTAGDMAEERYKRTPMGEMCDCTRRRFL
jgi:hypothetical protein